MNGYTNAEKQRMEEEELNKKVESLNQDELPTANIMVAGITGTGKSTLLNAIFGKDLAATGRGRPVTEHIDEYQSADVPIHIWDTVGLELDSEKTKDSINSIKQTIASKADSNNQFDRVHAIWYCINSGSNRYQGAELEFIRSLHSIGVPFIIVLTQCIGDPDVINQFEQQIRDINNSMGINDIEIVQVCAMPFKLRGFTIDAFGLNDLVDKTLARLPDFIKGGFIAAQKVSKGQKRELCESVISEYVDVAQKGFWDKIPIINVFTTDKKIKNMFKKIGRYYNAVLPEDNIDTIINDLGSIDFENGFYGLLSPIKKKYDRKLDQLFNKKKKEGFDVDVMKLDKSQRVARMLAYYGYTFLDAIEQVWDEFTENQLKNADMVLDRLRRILKEKFQIKN